MRTSILLDIISHFELMQLHLAEVDSYMKYANFLPLKHPSIAEAVPKKVLDNLMKLYRTPKSTITDLVDLEPSFVFQASMFTFSPLLPCLSHRWHRHSLCMTSSAACMMLISNQ